MADGTQRGHTPRSDHEPALAIASRLAPVDAADRIRRALEEQASIEAESTSDRPRLIAGDVDFPKVRLYLVWRVGTTVRSRRRVTRTLLSGTFLPSRTGSELIGEPVARRRGYAIFLWLWRGIVGALALLLCLGIAFDDRPDPAARVAGLLAVAALMLTASVALEASMTRQTRDDREALTRFLRTLLA